ncbi:DUF305 domain-containing protein [Methylobacterium sp. WL103]|uniref:DUF305 domain-containing protein n=1 Tax=Methylobacterium sp. WL103 TaxID=2603891 RepID=UPI0011C73BB1|nr:DUF305 domain-containing protein [Methylobacterium sp. WL103]TXN06794.1 DUF305 domain-containing protein [Methylobacterium sp. WL103]
MRGALGFAVTAALMASGLVGGRMMMRPTLAATEPAAAPSASFDAMMAQSMAQMHADMMVPPSGDPDRDFAAMIIPHHEGAIAMAKAELLHGKDPVLRRLAQGIVVEQGQEIDVMRRALADRSAMPGRSAGAPPVHHHGAAPAAEMPSEHRR